MNITQLLEIIDKYKYPILIFILVIVVCTYLILIFKQAHSNQLIILEHPNDCSNVRKSVSYDRFPSSKNNVQCTYSIWLYVDDRPGNAKRTHGDNHFYRVFSKESDHNLLLNNYYSCSKKKQTELMKKNIDLSFGSPGVYYRPNDGKLMITAQTSRTHKYITKSLLLQRWNNIVIVADNNYLDVYINNNLYRSYNLGSVINLGNGNLKIADSENNIYCKLSYFRYFSWALVPNEIYKLYEYTRKEYPHKPHLWWLFTPMFLKLITI